MKIEKPSRINLTIITLSFIVALIQVIILNRDSTTGEKLTFLKTEMENTEKVNEKLNQQIASNSAITTIIIRAKDFGLTNRQQLISLNQPQKLAYSDKLVL